MIDNDDILLRLERLEAQVQSDDRRKVTSECTMKFSLDDDDGLYAFRCAIASRDAQSALHDIKMKCRGMLKHGSPSAETRELLEEIRQIACSACVDDLV